MTLRTILVLWQTLDLSVILLGLKQSLIQISRRTEEQQAYGFGMVKTGHVANKKVSYLL